MTVEREIAHAKINLTLEVLGLRADGYHEIRSVMQTLTLSDELTLTLHTGKPWTLSCVWADDAAACKLPEDGSNLVWRAAELFVQHTGFDPGGLGMHLLKRIPAQAGLGGGSADAAAALRALNRAAGFPLSTEELCALAARVGCDIPFCVAGGTAYVTGRGETIRRLPDAPELAFVLCKPQFCVSTAELYRAIDASPAAPCDESGAMIDALAARDAARVGGALANDFEPLVAARQPVVEHLRRELIASGACGARLTGTGSVVYGVFADDAPAQSAAAHLRAEGFWTVAVRTAGTNV